MQRSYIKSLKISRDPAEPVNGRGTPFPRYGKPGLHVRTYFCAQIWQNL